MEFANDIYFINKDGHFGINSIIFQSPFKFISIDIFQIVLLLSSDHNLYQFVNNEYKLIAKDVIRLFCLAKFLTKNRQLYQHVDEEVILLKSGVVDYHYGDIILQDF